MENNDVMMKAMALVQGGRVEAQERPAPRPGAGQVQVALRAAACNRRDAWIRAGKYAGIRLPCVLGSDGAGVVSAVGPGVPEALLQREVIIYPALDWGPDPAVPGPRFRILGMPEDGTFAERIVVPAECAVDKPPHLTFEEAAALPLAALTAYRALMTRGRLRPGETVLLPGIGSGVQTMALMLAVSQGARVIVTSGSDEKLARARALGAAQGVNHRAADWDKALAAAAPDLAVDGAGGDTFARCLGVVRPGGRVVTYGATAGAAQVEVRRIFWKQLDVMGSTMGTLAEFQQMAALVRAGGLRPVVDTVMPLEQADEALARMERGEHMGKIVLRIAE